MGVDKREQDLKNKSGVNAPGAETVDQKEIDAIMAKYDRESAVRTFTGARKWFVAAVCILFSLVQIYAAFTANIPATQLRPLHLGFVMLLAYALYPIKKNMHKHNSLPWYDIVLALLAMGCCLYIALQHVELANRISKRFDPAVDPVGYRTYVMDMVVGGLLILLLAEACRRVVGYPILTIATLFVIYAFVGRSMPSFLAHRGFGLTRVITYLVYTTEGIMGTPLGASSTFIFLFVLFGAFLESTHVGQFFIDLSNAVAGHKRGGPAKVAVLASALEGTVSGSSVANTVGSGSFTIPMMKRLGYRGEFAGAVEAAASTGGQIMPPVMGAAAFLMAESVGVSYSEVVKAAIIPAILYFAGIWIIVELEARKYGLSGLSKDQMPKLARILRGAYLIFPLFVIIGFLGLGYTPVYAALVGIVSATLCGLVRRGISYLMHKRDSAKVEIWAYSITPLGGLIALLGVFGYAAPEAAASFGGITAMLIHYKLFLLLGGAFMAVIGCVLFSIRRSILRGEPLTGQDEEEEEEQVINWKEVAVKTGLDVVRSLENGARNVIGVAIACGVAGIIVGMITLTGLGLKMGNGLVAVAGGNQLLTLILTMLASIILGMGVPTTANYLITSTIMAPAVMGVMGCSMLTAHMFTFYFGIVADITPPVALAAMAGAAIAKSRPMATGFNAVKLAIAAFLVPYMFVFNEHMLMIGAQWYDIVQIVITALIGMLGVGAALEGYFTRHAHLLQRIMFLAGGLLLIDPNIVTDIMGITLVAVAVVWQEIENRRFGNRMEPAHNYYEGMSAGKKIVTVLTESFVMIGKLFSGKKSNIAG